MFGCARLSQGKIPLILTACWTGCAFLQNLGLSPGILANIPPHRVARLKRQGERYFADGLSDLSDNRRLSILAVCAVEWPADIADAIIETHDRIVGKTWREAKRLCDARVDDAKAAVRQTLRSFAELGSALLEAQGDKAELEPAISDNLGWEGLQNLVATAARLTDTMSADPLTHVTQGYNRFRRYAPRMLRVLDIHGAAVAAPLLKAACLIRDGADTEHPTGFLRRTSNWPDILRIAATMTAGTIAPSQILGKLASYPRQNDLAAALREIGRVERTLFMIDWILDADMQRRAQIGLNKGESHHALKNALRIGRQGEIRDRTTEGQHYRMAGLNLLTAIVIYWNTVRLGEAVNQRKRAGLPTPPELLAHTSPLGWAHILLTGEYRWSKKR